MPACQPHPWPQTSNFQFQPAPQLPPILTTKLRRQGVAGWNRLESFGWDEGGWCCSAGLRRRWCRSRSRSSSKEPPTNQNSRLQFFPDANNASSCLFGRQSRQSRHRSDASSGTTAIKYTSTTTTTIGAPAPPAAPPPPRNEPTKRWLPPLFDSFLAKQRCPIGQLFVNKDFKYKF